MALGTVIGALVGEVAVRGITRALSGRAKVPPSIIPQFTGEPTVLQPLPVPSKTIDIIPGTKFDIDPVTGEVTAKKKRRRRKRLLTCADKADIAFIVGTLGKGQTGTSAVTTLLARCN